MDSFSAGVVGVHAACTKVKEENPCLPIACSSDVFHPPQWCVGLIVVVVSDHFDLNYKIC